MPLIIPSCLIIPASYCSVVHDETVHQYADDHGGVQPIQLVIW